MSSSLTNVQNRRRLACFAFQQTIHILGNLGLTVDLGDQMWPMFQGSAEVHQLTFAFPFFAYRWSFSTVAEGSSEGDVFEEGGQDNTCHYTFPAVHLAAAG